MTVEELLAREAIRHTLATYNKCGDANDADGFAACFTENGSIHSLIFHEEGREAIRAWKASTKVFSQGKSGATAPFRVHYLSASHIEFVDADHARVRTPWMVVTDIGLDHCGVYQDVLRREGDQWLIEKRVIDTVWAAENSYIGSQAVRR